MKHDFYYRHVHVIGTTKKTLCLWVSSVLILKGENNQCVFIQNCNHSQNKKKIGTPPQKCCIKHDIASNNTFEANCKFLSCNDNTTSYDDVPYQCFVVNALVREKLSPLCVMGKFFILIFSCTLNFYFIKKSSIFVRWQWKYTYMVLIIANIYGEYMDSYMTKMVLPENFWWYRPEFILRVYQKNGFNMEIFFNIIFLLNRKLGLLC